MAVASNEEKAKNDIKLDIKIQNLIIFGAVVIIM